MKKSRLIRTDNSLLTGEKIEQLTPQQRWYRRNREIMSSKRKLSAPSRKEYDKKRYWENRDEILAQGKRYRNRPGMREKLATKQRLYYQHNINHYRDYVNNKTKLARIQVIDHYSHGSMKCACCGESIIDFLTIDHINMDGAEHRRKIALKCKDRRAPSGNRLYSYLVRNNFPEDVKLQVLCYNCNCGSYKNGGVCPHKIKK